ncbi:MAG: N-6 DNA methylase, partial [Dokdonella sp.]
MAKIKHNRDAKRQLGQFFTPPLIAKNLLDAWVLRADMRVLEPGFGKGAFLLPLVEAFMRLRNADLAKVLNENIWGVELDKDVYTWTLAEIERRWGKLPDRHNLILGDFLDPAVLAGYENRPGDLLGSGMGFDLIIGNPPFGGTVALALQDELERRYGRRHGCKIKRESYSLFIVKSLELLKDGATLEFICSDTFLTIPTMRGLRNALMEEGATTVRRLPEFSEETKYPMVTMRHVRGKKADEIVVDGARLKVSSIRCTGNLSWQVSDDHSVLFSGGVLAEYIVASSGMTTGKNEYFVRELDDDGYFDE